MVNVSTRANPVNYFFHTVMQEDNRVTKRCKICGRNYRASLGISSNFISHLKSAHKVEFAEFQRRYVLNYYPNSLKQPMTQIPNSSPGSCFIQSSGDETMQLLSGGHFSNAQQVECSVTPYQAYFPSYLESQSDPNTSPSSVKIETHDLEISDSEDSGWKKRSKSEASPSGSGTTLEDREALKFQLDAYKTEVSVIQREMKAEIESKDRQLLLLQQTLQNLQKHLTETSHKGSVSSDQNNSSSDQRPEIEAQAGTSDSTQNVSSSVNSTIKEREAKLIGVLSTFLHIHPMGAGIDYIVSYVQRVIDRNIATSEVEVILQQFPSMFSQSVTGVGASMERKWVSKIFDGCQIQK
ncbi:ecto-NOX disulfide-thiol exchanger 2-like [Artemia franciscana]